MNGKICIHFYEHHKFRDGLILLNGIRPLAQSRLRVSSKYSTVVSTVSTGSNTHIDHSVWPVGLAQKEMLHILYGAATLEAPEGDHNTFNTTKQTQFTYSNDAM